MPTLTIVPPMPGAERRFQPFVDFVKKCGWETEFVRLDFGGHMPPFGDNAIFPQVDAQTAGKVVMGFSLGALYAHLGALRARHLILGSISPFFLEDDDEPARWMVSYTAGNPATPTDILVGAREDEQMHRRAKSVYEFYRTGHQSRASDVPRASGSSNLPANHYSRPTTSHSPTFTIVPEAEHELWHPSYLHSIKAALIRFQP